MPWPTSRGSCGLLQYFIAFVYGNDLETIRLLANEVIPEVRRVKRQTATDALMA